MKGQWWSIVLWSSLFFKAIILTNKKTPGWNSLGIFFFFLWNLGWKQQFEDGACTLWRWDLGYLKRGCSAACTNWKRKHRWLWILTESNAPLWSCMEWLQRRCKVSFRTWGKTVSKYLINSSKCHWDVPIGRLECFLCERYWMAVILCFERNQYSCQQRGTNSIILNKEPGIMTATWAADGEIWQHYPFFKKCTQLSLMSSSSWALSLSDEHFNLSTHGKGWFLRFQSRGNIKNCQAMPVKAILVHFEQKYELNAAKSKKRLQLQNFLILSQ